MLHQKHWQRSLISVYRQGHDFDEFNILSGCISGIDFVFQSGSDSDFDSESESASGSEWNYDLNPGSGNLVDSYFIATSMSDSE